VNLHPIWRWLTGRLDRRKLILGGVGISFLLLAFAVVGPIASLRRFADDPLSSSTGEIALNQTVFPSLASKVALVRFADFDVKYPESMRENETKTVELVFRDTVVASKIQNSEPNSLGRDSSGEDLEYWHNGKHVIHESFLKPGFVELRTSAFNFAPGAKIEKPADTETPTTFIWTITPKSEGNHLIVLDISSLIITPIDLLGLTSTVENSLVVNGKKEAVTGPDHLTLYISVYNVWGLNRTSFEAIQALVGFVGFLLTLPVVIPLLKLLRKRISTAAAGSHVKGS
jgi:hypothetical protein